MWGMTSGQASTEAMETNQFCLDAQDHKIKTTADLIDGLVCRSRFPPRDNLYRHLTCSEYLMVGPDTSPMRLTTVWYDPSMLESKQSSSWGKLCDRCPTPAIDTFSTVRVEKRGNADQRRLST
jgi:hypothetical protein